MTAALLIIVAIAYLGGAFLVVAALAKALTTWSASWRARSHVAPVDEALQAQAAAAMAAVLRARTSYPRPPTSSPTSARPPETTTAPQATVAWP